MKAPPKLIGIAPQLVVRDVVKTAEYYRGVLGFHIIDYFLEPPVYAMVQRDGFQIHFGKADDEGFHTNENLRRGTTDLILWVPEIDAFFDELSGRGANIVQHIVKRVYGSREFIISDCDGHSILVAD